MSQKSPFYEEFVEVSNKLREMSKNQLGTANRLSILFALKSNDYEQVNKINEFSIIREATREDISDTLAKMRDEVKMLYLTLIGQQHEECEDDTKTCYVLAFRALALAEILQMHYYYV